MDEERYSAIESQLAALERKLRAKLAEHSQALKDAEMQQWDSTILARAEALWNEGQELRRRFGELIESSERMLRDDGIDLDLFERETASHLDPASRWWKRDLTPTSVNPTGENIEESLNRGFAELMTHVPQEWWRHQSALCDGIDESHFLSPLVLYGWHDCRPLPSNIHRYAYALRQAEVHIRGQGLYDVYNGAALVPVIAGLCKHFEALKEVKNGVSKLDEIPTSASEETESRIYELLVSARMAELGRSVELLQSRAMKSPDIRIHDLTFPAVAECKRQSRLSAYERLEVDRITELFTILVSERMKHGLVGELVLELRVPIDSVSLNSIAEIVLT